MRQLYALHQNIEKLVVQLINLYQSGRIEQAHDGFKEVEVKSEEFLNLLTRFEGKLTYAL
ncbi:hypothetical protein GCM10028895_16480 [Pontibacter rugosus]